jgi:hypothetical protein
MAGFALLDVVVPTPSSPVHTTYGDDKTVLRKFFSWYIEWYGLEDKQELYRIEETLIDECWSVDALRTTRRGGWIDTDIWDKWGFKLGLLFCIQGRITEFKYWIGDGSELGDSSGRDS